MRRTAKLLILLLLLAALPLRGYAAAIKPLCEAHHAGSQAAHHAMHEHAAAHEHGSPQDGTATGGDLASLSSLCSTASAGAPLAPDAVQQAAAVVTASDRIPFLGGARSGFVPDRLDRPPLAL